MFKEIVGYNGHLGCLTCKCKLNNNNNNNNNNDNNNNQVPSFHHVKTTAFFLNINVTSLR